MYRPEKSVVGNILLLEELKSDLLSAVARLFRAMIQGRESMVLESISRIIITAFLLGRRAGFNYHRIGRAVEQKAQVLAGDKGEEWREDLQDLLNYLDSQKG